MIRCGTKSRFLRLNYSEIIVGGILGRPVSSSFPVAGQVDLGEAFLEPSEVDLEYQLAFEEPYAIET